MSCLGLGLLIPLRTVENMVNQAELELAESGIWMPGSGKSSFYLQAAA